MKKLYATTNYSLFFKNPLKFLIIVFLFTSTLYNGHGQVREPFQARTSNANPTQTIYSVKGDFAMIGNTNLTLVNYGTNANNYGDMEFVDMDGTAVPGNNTFNSSSATLQFSTENGASPECSNIIYAGLYWTGRGDAGLTEQEMRTVKLKGPNDLDYETYTTTNEIRFPGDDRMYVGYIEVTDQVEANGIGEYFVADIATSEGNGGNTGYYGGWGMVVVYENSKMNWRDITIFDGYAYIPGNESVFYDINISGFNAVQSGNVNIKLGVMAGEGDVAVTGDYFEIQRRDDLTFERLSHSSDNTTTGNFFNSSINTGGNPRSPDLANNTGVDIAMFNIDNTGNGIINNNQTSTTIRYGSTKDSYVIFNVAFAVDAYVPDSEGVIANTSINGNPPSGTNSDLEPGQAADFSIEIKNKGTEAINNAVITIPFSEPIDPAVDFDFSFSPSSSPAPIYDSNVGSNGAIVWELGNLPLPSNPDEVLATLSFTLTVTKDCSILSNENFDPNVSITGTISGEGATSGDTFDRPLILGIQQNGNCQGEPITGAIEIPIDYINYINQAPTASNPEPINITCVDDIPTPDPLVVTDEADNSGIAPIVAFVSDVSDDEDCPEVITRTYSVTDDCGNSIPVEQIITISPVPLSVEEPEDYDAPSCDFTDQDAVNTAFSDWVAEQSAAITISGGCDPQLSNDSASATIPLLCDGGTATVTWTIKDICDSSFEVSADFTINAPETVQYNAPQDDASTASEFDDPDANVAQQNLDDDIAAWVTAQNNAINSSLSGGCSPTITNNFVDQSIAFCASGSITITWTIQDLCGTTSPTATYSFTQPDGIDYTNPSEKEVNACDFYNEDLSTAQDNLNTDIAAWVTEQTNIITNSISTGSPEITNNYNNESINLCEGGSITVTWAIDDICENINTSATYTVNPAADDLTYTAPSDLDAQSCDYTDQTAVNEAFNNWVAAQTAAIAPNQGCSPVLSDNSDSVSIPQLCDGGTATVTWTINDLCEGPIELSADFDLEQPVPVAYTAPSDLDALSCDYADQTAVNEAFNNWVAAQTAAIAPNQGCSPILSDNSDSVSIPQLCDGGTATVTWTINDLCEGPIELSADFDLEQPVPVAYTAPSDLDAQSCDYADQTAVNEAFNNWVAAQTAAIVPNGGCSPVLGNNSDSVSIPQLCDGGTATVTWTITDLCIDSNFSADFNLEKPEDITYNQPNNLAIEACNYTDQDAINSAFNDWVTTQTATINPTGGCDLTFTNTSAEITIPQFCEGGVVTVTWTITDLCDTITESADFEVIAPQTVEYDAPQNDSSTASEFDDPDANVAQQNLDDDIAAWVAAQNDAVTNSLTGGCAPAVTNDFTDQSISFCTSGSITITWTVEDVCSTTNPTATYTFTQPDGISFTNPSSETVNTCDFFNEDAQIAQNELNDAISTWVNEQTDIINNSLSGGSPDVTHDYNNESIDLCEGGSVTVNWTIDDICETINIAATYNVVPADAITHTAPTDLNAQSCDYADQNELNEAFNTWVTEQTEAFAITGGCSPTLADDSATATIPQLCDGGTATITWTITDLCETISVSADFIITPTATTTFTNPADDTSDACEFGTDDLVSAQQNLDADLLAWVNTQTQNINDSFSGGCSPTVSNDFENQTIDFCTSEAITVNWEITDLCDTIKVSATYTYTAPDAPSFVENLPTDVTVECDAVPTADVLTASNSCGVIDVNYTEDRTDGDCPSTYTLLRTWNATNICGVVTTHQQTITVQDTTAPVLSLPNNVTAECSDDLTPIAFGEATATDDCDANPVITYEDKITNGSCPGDYTIIRTWTATDACGNVATADQTISTSDTTAPVFDQTTLPGNVVVECSGIPEPEILTATDNCGTAIVTVDDAITEGNCAGNYVITRSYTATDECGITNTHVQTITVQDTTPPVFVEDFPLERIVVECDAIPTPETLTATDTCGSATVSVSDTRTDGTCTNNYILARTWTAEDECGLTTTFTQIITVQDTTPPTFVETLPRDVTVECDAIPDAETITATDNCGDAVVTVNDVITDGSCPNSYTIERTYTATDECDLTTTHTQIITVQDTTAPVPTTAYEETISTSCIDIEAAPELEFADNCSTNVIVEFEETSTFEEGVFADYQIIRTWTVRDACNNEAVYTQTINVALDVIETQVVADDRCFDDGPVNLRDHLADNVTSGTWEIIEGNPLATIEGDIFDPTNLEDAYTEEFNPNTDGITYVLRFTGFEDGCMNVTDVTMVIDAKCKVLPCGESDVIISKAITPNGDGKNETFDIEGIDLCGFVAEVKIFNRWGALVYESNNYTLGSLRTSGLTGDWDGSAPKSSFGNAGKLPNGTYYYIINLRDSGLSPLTGPIYLGTK